jgi:integral membrane protein (TIGR01906 family)
MQYILFGFIIYLYLDANMAIMGVRKAISLVLIAIIVLNLPLIAYIGISLNLIFDRGFYTHEIAKNSIQSNFGDKALPETLVTQLLAYFSQKTDQPPQIFLFTPDENRHLLDVKILIDEFTGILYVSAGLAIALLLLLLLFFPKQLARRIGRLLLWSGAITLVLTILFIVLALNFSWAFTEFHLVLFPQGNWSFPSDSYLIQLFPREFFYDFFLTIILRGAIVGALLLTAGMLISRRRKEYKTANHQA